MSKTVDSKTPDSKGAARDAKAADDWQTYVEDFRRAGHETVDWIAQYLTNGSRSALAGADQTGRAAGRSPENRRRERRTL